MAELQSMPMAEARRLHVAASEGDVEAKAFFVELFAGGGHQCWLCAMPGEHFAVAILPDPTAPGMAILMPECVPCRGMPQAERRRRQAKMLKAMWPNARFEARKDADPSYMRGPRVKLRRAAE